jgi:hypothetical protein
MFDAAISDLPFSLRHLQFGDCYNRPLPSNLPCITHITFGRKFGQPLDGLPMSLLHLHLSSHYALKITQVPVNLVSFSIGTKSETECKFVYPVDFLPPTLTDLNLHLPGHFTAEINFPASLLVVALHITTGRKNGFMVNLESAFRITSLQLYGFMTVENIPPSLIDCFLDKQVHCLDVNTPPCMEYLTLLGKVGWKHLPRTLQRLHISGGNEIKYGLSSLPLQELKVGPMMDFPVDSLPLTLRTLQMDNYKASLSSLQPQISKLTILNEASLINHIPPTVTHLFLPSYTKQIERLPAKLAHLCVGKNEHPLPLPSSLDSLELIVSSATPSLSFPNNSATISLYTRKEVKVTIDLTTHKIFFSACTYNPY